MRTAKGKAKIEQLEARIAELQKFESEVETICEWLDCDSLGGVRKFINEQASTLDRHVRRELAIGDELAHLKERIAELEKDKARVLALVATPYKTERSTKATETGYVTTDIDLVRVVDVIAAMETSK